MSFRSETTSVVRAPVTSITSREYALVQKASSLAASALCTKASPRTIRSSTVPGPGGTELWSRNRLPDEPCLQLAHRFLASLSCDGNR